MDNEKQNWQVQLDTMLDTLTALPMWDGVAVWELDRALRQSAQAFGALHDAGIQDGTMVPGTNAKTDSGTTKVGQRSAYQETRARRRQSEELLQI